MAANQLAGPVGIAGAAFARAFPFFLHLDDQLCVRAAGPSLLKAHPGLRPGAPLASLFRVRRPRDVGTLQAWRARTGELCTLAALDVPGLTLRGSAESCDDGSLLLLVAPVLGSLDDVARLGLGFNDFAKHDATGDSLLLAQTTRMSGLDAQRMSERLRQRTEQMTTMLELSQSGVVYFDAARDLQQINSALLAMLGLARDGAFELDIDALDAWIDDRLDPDAACRRPLAWLIEGSPPAQAGITLQLRLPNAAVIHAVGARTPDGGWVFYFRDVTHETEVDRMKSEFLTTAAHELRTPMVSVFGFTELLLHRPVGEERRRDMLTTIHRQASLLINMVNELLDLARIEARQGRDMRPEPCRVSDLVEATLSALMVQGDERRVQAACLHADAWLTVDPAKIQRALLNVLSNAYKFSPGGGDIRLETVAGSVDGQPALGLRVVDQGIGMQADQARRVFERFYRADPSGNIPGTGLGMSLVKEIVELHGGRVDLLSEPGQGTEVTLWLPLQGPSGQPAPRRAASARLQ